MAEGDVSYPNTNGSTPVDNIKSEASRTGAEIRDLKNLNPTAATTTGQHLTYYHSLLYSLLSWEQPRATAASFASVVFFIFAARYLPLLRWAFKLAYVLLGFTAVTEIGGRLVFSQSIASSFRPRKYYTIPKETTEAIVEDVEQLVDFVLLEFQRVLFAENVVHTVAAFLAAFSAYWLIKFLPFWSLSLIAVTIAYLGPLIYINNRELIDSQVAEIQKLVNSQASHLKDLAGERTQHATGLVKQYVGGYSAKAQGYINRRSASPEMAKVPTPVKKEAAEPGVKVSDFPDAPKEPLSNPKQETLVESIEPTQEEREPLLA